MPKGRFSTEYTVRLNNPGTFQLPPTRVEAMYAPEMFGERPNAAGDRRARHHDRIRVRVIGGIVAIAVVAACARRGCNARTVPDFETVRARWQSSEAYLLDRHGALIDSARIDYGVRRFEWVPLDAVSTALIDAVIDGEDRRFCRSSRYRLARRGSARCATT